ncbi:hypothetical protein PTSG_03212 [Salpingoeca rosetta]|uniref:Mediator of RNA polymerase II transcription subunit 21 n=1 Tax=Salpingoeca rosetta (strain ATCC 50818 / BSB-021) TaxID=946362 RepID=F2U4J4_SALR5|nr:uncharacterized protein PTSG_03212 [Salpingoeca rosetta]EGD82560.1 hypothetical protein PTSG_03212 [Salpingoeca rosetta]|eukprot:XP_004995796.1 hypothetical protein PTSG_03212 [Salpingoeca rosetta]
MGDRVTQLQELLQALMEHYRNAVGVLHMQAGEAAMEPAPSSAKKQPQKQPQKQQNNGEEGAVASARQQVQQTVDVTKHAILQTVKDINLFCDHLPDIKQATNTNDDDLDELHRKNAEAASLLRTKVQLAEERLALLRGRITDITNAAFLTQPKPNPAALPTPSVPASLRTQRDTPSQCDDSAPAEAETQPDKTATEHQTTTQESASGGGGADDDDGSRNSNSGTGPGNDGGNLDSKDNTDSTRDDADGSMARKRAKLDA